MSIFDSLGRIPKIVEANLNTALNLGDKPAVSSNQLLRDTRKQLDAVRKQTVEVIANYTKIKQELEDCEAQLEQTPEGPERQRLLQLREKLADRCESARSTAEMMKQAYQKMVDNVNALEQKASQGKVNPYEIFGTDIGTGNAEDGDLTDQYTKKTKEEIEADLAHLRDTL